MNLAISNIAWEPSEDDAVAALLRAAAVTAIDIAPGKYFPDPAQASAAQIKAVRQAWADRGLRIHGMQSLLFGTVGLNVFGNQAVQTALLARLEAVCQIAAGLGAGPLVFGSPRQRDRTGLDDAQAEAVAVRFFRQVGDCAARHGVTVCLEANPQRYGCNFMTTTAEAAHVVMHVDHPAIRLQLDTGTMTVQGESVVHTVAEWGAYIGHIHASEPDLQVLGEGGCDHRAMAQALRIAAQSGRVALPEVVSIEMLTPPAPQRLAAIAQALHVAAQAYVQPGVVS